jgi:hypothetical protein
MLSLRGGRVASYETTRDLAIAAELAALLAARFELDTCLTARLVDSARVGFTRRAVMDADATARHLESHVPEVPWLELLQDIFTTGSAPTHQVCRFDQDRARSLITTRPALQTVEHLCGVRRRCGGRLGRSESHLGGCARLRDVAQQRRPTAVFTLPRLPTRRVAVEARVALFEVATQFDSLSGDTCACVCHVLRYQQYGVVPTECHSCAD